jgi:hypothetical protein
MMKTAKRPANVGIRPSGKGSAAVLPLNFSPLEFEDAEVDVGVFSYGANRQEVLK